MCSWQDYVRTGAYYEAITQNGSDFQGSTVMDVGAGSGILSLFAAQATLHSASPLDTFNSMSLCVVEILV